MNAPPMVLRMKIARPSTSKRRINLWLPLFIIVPVVAIIAFALFLLLLPLMLLAAAIFWRRGLWRPVLFFWPVVVTSFGAMRGFEVDIARKRERVFISFK